MIQHGSFGRLTSTGVVSVRFIHGNELVCILYRFTVLFKVTFIFSCCHKYDNFVTNDIIHKRAGLERFIVDMNLSCSQTL